MQENAIGSIVDKSASLMDPINDRKATLGFQQDRTRHLLDLATKVSLHASLHLPKSSPGPLHACEVAPLSLNLDCAALA